MAPEPSRSRRPACRLFGPAYPARGTLATTQASRSAFELGWDARLPARRAVSEGRPGPGDPV